MDSCCLHQSPNCKLAQRLAIFFTFFVAMATNWLGSAHEQVPSVPADILRSIDLLAWVLVDG